MEKAIFVIVLASSMRVSQLCALTFYPVWTVFAPDESQVLLVPFPKVSAKNESESHYLDPFVIPYLFEGDCRDTLSGDSALMLHRCHGSGLQAHFL